MLKSPNCTTNVPVFTRGDRMLPRGFLVRSVTSMRKARHQPRPCEHFSIESLLRLRRAAGLRIARSSQLVGRHHHRRVGIQQARLVGTQTQLDQRPRVRNRLGLPAIGFLETRQGVFGGLVPSFPSARPSSNARESGPPGSAGFVPGRSRAARGPSTSLTSSSCLTCAGRLGAR